MRTARPKAAINPMADAKPGGRSAGGCPMADIDVHYDPISVVNSPVTVDVKGLDNTKNVVELKTPQPLKLETKSDLAVTQPIQTESKFAFATPQPLKSESKSELDVKPLAVEQCLRISLAPLPPACIRFPTHQHIGFTLFGFEIFGVRYSGETQVLVCEPAKDPHVVWGDVTSVLPSEKRAGVAPATEGLRIRLGA
jgi:hypothetical protein